MSTGEAQLPSAWDKQAAELLSAWDRQALRIAEDFLAAIWPITSELAGMPVKPTAETQDEREFDEFIGLTADRIEIPVLIPVGWSKTDYAFVLRDGLHLIYDGSEFDTPFLRATIDSIAEHMMR